MAVNMQQQALFFDSWEEALLADIQALGGRKKLAPRLWPGDTEETANDRLKACLAPGHKQALKPSEVMTIKRMAREVGSTSTVSYEAQQLGYQVHWLDPEDEADAIRRELRDSFKVMTKHMARLEQLETKR